MASTSSLSGEYIKIGEAAELLGVTKQTLRNWDKSGKLVPQRHPMNGYRMYRIREIHEVLKEIQRVPSDTSDDQQTELPLPDLTTSETQEVDELESDEQSDLPPCHWSPEVALDPRHRPQRLDQPSTTVRRDWRKYPQEAHVLDLERSRYRRLQPEEIAALQGFEPSLLQDCGLTDRQKIAAVGDAVPPPLARAIVAGITDRWEFESKTALEICAGAGGLAEGAAYAGLEHLALIDQSEVCEVLLKKNRGWPPNRVEVADVRTFDYSSLPASVGLLSAGPPCQPWSHGGHRKGQDDPRDLFGWLPKLVSRVEPEVFIFENVPGLTHQPNREYLRSVVSGLSTSLEDGRYGVVAAVLNAADFGVPQVRRRLFVLGLRNAPAADAHQIFDAIDRRRTHRDPNESNSDLPTWRTVGNVLADLPDPGGWRQWIIAEN